MKSVLLHAQDDNGFEARYQAALELARASAGHVTCIQVTPSSAYVAFDGFGGVFVMTEVMNKIEEQRVGFKTQLEARLASEDVSWDYIDCADDPAHALVSRASLADVLVLSCPSERSGKHDSLAFAGDVAVSARTPVLAVPQDFGRFDPSGPAAIAWNASFEAANALRAALPLLKRASAVHLLAVEEEKPGQLPSAAASKYLSRHGIASEVRSEPHGGRFPEEALADMVKELGASYLVMGAYGHSRAREFVFGGVTRAMLVHSRVPLLLAR